MGDLQCDEPRTGMQPGGSKPAAPNRAGYAGMCARPTNRSDRADWRTDRRGRQGLPTPAAPAGHVEDRCWEAAGGRQPGPRAKLYLVCPQADRLEGRAGSRRGRPGPAGNCPCRAWPPPAAAPTGLALASRPANGLAVPVGDPRRGWRGAVGVADPRRTWLATPKIGPGAVRRGSTTRLTNLMLRRMVQGASDRRPPPDR